MLRKIETFFDMLLCRRFGGQRVKVMKIWCDSDNKILVDKNGLILAQEVWRHV